MAQLAEHGAFNTKDYGLRGSSQGGTVRGPWMVWWPGGWELGPVVERSLIRIPDSTWWEICQCALGWGA